MLLVCLFLLSLTGITASQDTDSESCDANGPYGESCKGAEGKKDTYSVPDECVNWARKCECQANPAFMLGSCAKSCAMYECKNKEPNCRALVGKVSVGTECTDDLWEKCALTCHKMQLAKAKKTNAAGEKNEKKCTRINSPGGLHERSIPDMFGRIADEGWAEQHEPKVLSRDPWMIYFDKFLTPRQMDELWEGMAEVGASFSPSTEISSGGSNQRRTSESMHCPNPSCFADPRLLAVHEVITNVTGLDLNMHELPQLLKYRPGQFYVQHQDTSDDYGKAAHGNRIYTLFMYLSDLPAGAGGETHFPSLGIKVPPKRGAAVLWSNVHANNPRRVDSRTNHESLPVLNVTGADGESPTKFAGNFWLYGHDWRTQWKNGCMNVNAGF